MPRVIVLVAPDGTTVMKVEGVAGPACLLTTKKLEEALGTVTDRRAHGEMSEDTVKQGESA